MKSGIPKGLNAFRLWQLRSKFSRNTTNKRVYLAIRSHLEQHGLLTTDLVYKQFSVLKKCLCKFDCLILEKLFIKELNPKLNTQKDSIRAKLVTLCANILTLSLHIFTFFICVS